MNSVLEHPQTLDLKRRLEAVSESESKDKCIPVQLFMPVQGMMMGTVELGEVPGLFVMTARVRIEGSNQEGMMKFSFTADKPISIIHPDLTEAPEKSRIIQ